MSSSDTEKSTFFTPKNILGIVLAIAALIFVFLNTGISTLNLFGLRLSLPGWIWLIGLLAIGFIVGSLFPWFTGKNKK